MDDPTLNTKIAFGISLPVSVQRYNKVDNQYYMASADYYNLGDKAACIEIGIYNADGTWNYDFIEAKVDLMVGNSLEAAATDDMELTLQGIATNLGWEGELKSTDERITDVRVHAARAIAKIKNAPRVNAPALLASFLAGRKTLQPATTG
jgi:hypothetical protein